MKVVKRVTKIWNPYTMLVKLKSMTSIILTDKFQIYILSNKTRAIISYQLVFF